MTEKIRKITYWGLFFLFVLLVCIFNISPSNFPTNEIEATINGDQPKIKISPTSISNLIPTDLPVDTQAPLNLLISKDEFSPVNYKLPITIRRITTTGVVLFFELEVPASGIIVYWENGNDDKYEVIEFGLDKTRHLVEIAGLDLDTEYQVKVGVITDEGNYLPPDYFGSDWGEIRFHTLDDSYPLCAGIIGDSGFGSPKTQDLALRMVESDLDMVFHVGDVVYNLEEQSTPFDAYKLKYFESLSPLLHEMPIYTVISNHDYELAAQFDGSPFYFYVFPPFVSASNSQWYSFSYKEYQFVFLDTQTLFGEGGREEQEKWLEERLIDTRYKFTVPIFHVSPFSSGPHSDDGLIVRWSWDEYFYRDTVPLALSGHEHFYERAISRDTTFIITGGGSPILYNLEEKLPESIVVSIRMNFLRICFFEDRIEIEAIGLNGDLIDKTTLDIE